MVPGKPAVADEPGGTCHSHILFTAAPSTYGFAWFLGHQRPALRPYWPVGLWRALLMPDLCILTASNPSSCESWNTSRHAAQLRPNRTLHPVLPASFPAALLASVDTWRARCVALQYERAWRPAWLRRHCVRPPKRGWRRGRPASSRWGFPNKASAQKLFGGQL